MVKTSFWAKVHITKGVQARVTIPIEHWKEIHNLKNGQICRFTIDSEKPPSGVQPD